MTWDVDFTLYLGRWIIMGFDRDAVRPGTSSYAFRWVNCMGVSVGYYSRKRQRADEAKRKAAGS